MRISGAAKLLCRRPTLFAHLW